ncbi:OsmC family protein [Microterricola pindariensis]|uniref:OsmC family protein n=1 Tax=Microterricola pindariensis TaxID=478010 RepID=UPI000CEBE82A|nr:OsmC family protein [Microterricola pindariensis]
MSADAAALSTTPAVPTITAEARQERLTAVATNWVATIAEQPAKAQLRFTASGEGVGSVGTTIRTGKHTFQIDEPAGLGGDNAAANPVEVALAAIIACQVVSYRVWALNLGVVLDTIEASAEGDLDVRGFFGLDDTVRPGFTAVRVTVNVSGPESEARYRELHAAVDAHCPVLDLFANPTPVQTTLVVD